MLFLILMILMLLCLSTADAQESTTPLPPVIVEGVPLPTGAIPDRLRTQEQARQEIERIPGGAEVVGPKVVIVGAVAQHVVGGGEHGGGHRDDGLSSARGAA